MGVFVVRIVTSSLLARILRLDQPSGQETRAQQRNPDSDLGQRSTRLHKSETEDKKPFRILLLTGQPAGRPRVETVRQTDRRNRKTEKWRKRQTDRLVQKRLSKRMSSMGGAKRA